MDQADDSYLVLGHTDTQISQGNCTLGGDLNYQMVVVCPVPLVRRRALRDHIWYRQSRSAFAEMGLT
jgi:hypothetical protein